MLRLGRQERNGPRKELGEVAWRAAVVVQPRPHSLLDTRHNTRRRVLGCQRGQRVPAQHEVGAQQHHQADIHGARGARKGTIGMGHSDAHGRYEAFCGSGSGSRRHSRSRTTATHATLCQQRPQPRHRRKGHNGCVHAIREQLGGKGGVFLPPRSRAACGRLGQQVVFPRALLLHPLQYALQGCQVLGSDSTLGQRRRLAVITHHCEQPVGLGAMCGCSRCCGCSRGGGSHGRRGCGWVYKRYR